jgi:hypothetical protein
MLHPCATNRHERCPLTGTVWGNTYTCDCSCHKKTVPVDEVYEAHTLTPQQLEHLRFMRFLYRCGLIGVHDNYSPLNGATVPKPEPAVTDESLYTDTDD